MSTQTQLRQSESHNQAIALSVIVATSQPWPELRMCLDSLHDQAVQAGAEVIVADGTGRGLPDDVTGRYPEVTWLKAPGCSVPQLRALAMSQACGEVVAVTEDHCRVAPDWYERILDAQTVPELLQSFFHCASHVVTVGIFAQYISLSYSCPYVRSFRARRH